MRAHFLDQAEDTEVHWNNLATKRKDKKITDKSNSRQLPSCDLLQSSIQNSGPLWQELLAKNLLKVLVFIMNQLASSLLCCTSQKIPFFYGLW